MRLVDYFVSVIIPVYNGELFISAAVNSVLQNQGNNRLEIIIVDDESTDGTAEVVKNLPSKVRYVRQKNQGPAAARNLGLSMAGGDIIAFLDCDDLWPEGRLDDQLNYLERHPNVNIILGKIKRLYLGDLQVADFQESEEPFVSFNLGSALFRKSVFDLVGPFDTSLRYSEDVDWFNRAREIGISIVVLDKVTLLYRKHTSNMTMGKNPNELNILRVLKKSIDRRRQMDGDQIQPLAPVHLSSEEDLLSQFSPDRPEDL